MFNGYIQGLGSDTRVTQRQLELMRLVAEYAATHNGLAPAASDLADQLNPSVHVNTVWGMVVALRRKGLVQSTYGVHRSLQLTTLGKAVLTKAAALAGAANSDFEGHPSGADFVEQGLEVSG